MVMFTSFLSFCILDEPDRHIRFIMSIDFSTLSHSTGAIAYFLVSLLIFRGYLREQ